MCGIFGSVGKKHGVARKMMCVANTTRGAAGSQDGTGLVWGNCENWTALKNKKSGIEFIADSDVSDENWNSHILLGHVRGASRSLGAGGGVGDANTHPFEHGDIVLAHNGMFRNWNSHIPTGEFQKWKVDSDLLAKKVSEEGASFFSNVEGPAACWWINKNEPDQFHLFCWDQDLWIWRSDKEFAFSSEQPFLSVAGFTKKTGKVKKLDGKGEHIVVYSDGKIKFLQKVAGKKSAAAAGYGNNWSSVSKVTTGVEKVSNTGVYDKPPGHWVSLTAGYSEGDLVGVYFAGAWCTGRIDRISGQTYSITMLTLPPGCSGSPTIVRSSHTGLYWIPANAFRKKCEAGEAKKLPPASGIELPNAPVVPLMLPQLLSGQKVSRCPKCKRLSHFGTCAYCGTMVTVTCTVRPEFLGSCPECGGIYPMTGHELEALQFDPACNEATIPMCGECVEDGYVNGVMEKLPSEELIVCDMDETGYIMECFLMCYIKWSYKMIMEDKFGMESCYAWGRRVSSQLDAELAKEWELTVYSEEPAIGV